MSNAVIPAPGSFDYNGREFVFRSGTIAYINIDVAPIVERFCLEVTRRTGLRVLPMTGNPGSNEPSIRVELTTGDEFGVLPAPRGVSPLGDRSLDERHSLVIDEHQILVRAAEPVGVARGLSTLIQLLATTASTSASEVSLSATRILDAPRYAWRGLSLDLARTFFTVGEVKRVIDLLALYKLNVLHLHLTDDQSWRLPVGRSAENSKSDVAFYSAEDLRGLVAYAEDRFVTIVPEVDTPGHASAFVRMRPELNTGRNLVEFEFPPGHTHHTAWLDPELPATFEAVEEVLAGVAAIFRGPYIHIGGDEPRGMPRDLYSSYVQRIRGLVRSMGKRAAGMAGISACRPWPGRRHPVLALRHRPSAIIATRGPSADGRGRRYVSPRRRDGSGGISARHRFAAEPLLPRRPLRRAVGRSWAGGEAGPGRAAALFTQDRR